jgi:hypothetical protein
MAKTAGKGTTVSIDATAIGAGLVIEVTPFRRTQATDDITAIDSAAESRAGSLPSFGPASVRMFWDKSDAAQDDLKGATEDTEFAVVITYPDGATETANCILTDLGISSAARTGRLEITAELTPTGAVTYADGA